MDTAPFDWKCIFLVLNLKPVVTLWFLHVIRHTMSYVCALKPVTVISTMHTTFARVVFHQFFFIIFSTVVKAVVASNYGQFVGIYSNIAMRLALVTWRWSWSFLEQIYAIGCSLVVFFALLLHSSVLSCQNRWCCWSIRCNIAITSPCLTLSCISSRSHFVAI